MSNESAQIISRIVIWSLPVVFVVVGFVLRRFLATVDTLAGGLRSLENSVVKLTAEFEAERRQNERHHQENLARIGRGD